MSRLTAIYIDFIQEIGVIVIFGLAASAVKEILFRVEKAHIKLED